MSSKIYLYPVWVRLWHLVNALMIILLILTGVSMQYSNPDAPFIRFDLAVSWHNIAGIILTVNYLLFIIGNIATHNGKYYRLRAKGLIDRLIKQFKYYTLGVYKGQQPPFPINEQRKFNPLQKIAYAFIMYLFMPLLFITGWALLFPETIWLNVFGVSGILLTALLHIVMGFVISVFLLVHIYFCTFGATATATFRSMISGYHEGH
ncbi:MAG: cytochrome B [Clostridia bacterium]|nr:cytochrome B [Clostridia bacterium]